MIKIAWIVAPRFWHWKDGILLSVESLRQSGFNVKRIPSGVEWLLLK